MWCVGAGHGHGVLVVLQAVGGFVFDFAISRLLLHANFKAAALHHEAGNHTVKHGVAVVAFVNVAQKIGDGFGGFGGIQLQRDHAVVFDVEFYFWVAHDDPSLIGVWRV